MGMKKDVRGSILGIVKGTNVPPKSYHNLLMPDAIYLKSAAWKHL
jgi:hypothetical protein